jgi:hypothetical protein
VYLSGEYLEWFAIKSEVIAVGGEGVRCRCGDGRGL